MPVPARVGWGGDVSEDGRRLGRDRLGLRGSVAALRLAQKGYSVRVLESGSRFGDQDFAGSTWDARRYFFAPRLGLRGIMRLTPFPTS